MIRSDDVTLVEVLRIMNLHTRTVHDSEWFICIMNLHARQGQCMIQDYSVLTRQCDFGQGTLYYSLWCQVKLAHDSGTILSGDVTLVSEALCIMDFCVR